MHQDDEDVRSMGAPEIMVLKETFELNCGSNLRDDEDVRSIGDWQEDRGGKRTAVGDGREKGALLNTAILHCWC